MKGIVSGMIHVLVSGYGVMTRGIIPHLARQPGITVSLLSRHQTTPPCPGVATVAPDNVSTVSPDVIIGCFEDEERSHEFWTNPQLQRLISERHTSCIEMSTLSHGWAVKWHEVMASLGATSVESPVTGSRVGAANGSLSAFVYQSAPDIAVDRVLDAFISKRYEFHAPGNATRFKLVYNAWGAAILHSLTAFVPTLESILGDDFDVAADVVKNDGWMAPVCASKLDRMIDQKYDDPDFAIKHMVKDLRYARDVLGTSNELLNMVSQAFVAAEKIHGGSADYTAVTAAKAS
ncbi:NAD(P)-binding domain-containing protein [Streptomyces yangpuensis]|uniref:NAD(P)-binding domain-containing protein n=1 Tax=Streptomyces yangpuensis TaxID=1648182 RepID=UPI0038158532